MNLSQVWKQSIKQWTWIVQQLDDDTKLSIEVLKRQWLDLNGYWEIKYSCLFCEYAFQDSTSRPFCGDCPAILADNRLNKFWCQRYEHNYAHQPRAFLAKLEETYAKFSSYMSVL